MNKWVDNIILSLVEIHFEINTLEMKIGVCDINISNSWATITDAEIRISLSLGFFITSDYNNTDYIYYCYFEYYYYT